MGVDIACRQPLDQRIDARAGGGIARAQVVPLGGDRRELLLEQGIGPLELFVAKDQPLDAVGEVFECGHCAAVLNGRVRERPQAGGTVAGLRERHRRGRRNGSDCSGAVRQCLQLTVLVPDPPDPEVGLNGKQDGQDPPGRPSLCCPRNGHRTGVELGFHPLQARATGVEMRPGRPHGARPTARIPANRGPSDVASVGREVPGLRGSGLHVPAFSFPCLTSSWALACPNRPCVSLLRLACCWACP